MLEKMRGGLEKNKFFFIDFSSKIDQKSIKKSRKTTFAAKIDKKALPGTAFWGKSRFLVIFGLPGGTQKLLKIYESFWVKGSWEPSGSHFGRFSAFFSILAPLLVHSGSILGPPGSIFSRLLHFFFVFWERCFYYCIVFRPWFSCHLFIFASFVSQQDSKTTTHQDNNTAGQHDNKTAGQQDSNTAT